MPSAPEAKAGPKPEPSRTPFQFTRDPASLHSFMISADDVPAAGSGASHGRTNTERIMMFR